MNKKVLLAVAAAVVLGVVGYFVFYGDSMAPTEVNAPESTNATEQTGTTTTSTTSNTTTTTVTVPAGVTRVTYQDGAFNPKNIEIKAGETVEFLNNSSSSIFIASAPHPTHTSYPALDSGDLKAGATYKISFPNPVTVSYHNHYHPSATGTITVK